MKVPSQRKCLCPFSVFNILRIEDYFSFQLKSVEKAWRNWRTVIPNNDRSTIFTKLYPNRIENILYWTYYMNDNYGFWITNTEQ